MLGLTNKITKFNAWFASMCRLNFICQSSGHYKLCAFINWRSSKPSSINPFSHFLSDHSHWYSSKTEEKYQVTVSVTGVCMHFPFLSLWPSFCSFFLLWDLTRQYLLLFLYSVLFPLWICHKDIKAYHQFLMFPSFPVLNCTFEKHTWKIQRFLHAQKNCC